MTPVSDYNLLFVVIYTNSNNSVRVINNLYRVATKCWLIPGTGSSNVYKLQMVCTSCALHVAATRSHACESWNPGTGLKGQLQPFP
jgi:uncharacterized Fe-S cluster protein YjdI